MDNLPYDFVDKVFTMLDHDTIQKNIDQCFESPLWNEVAAVYKKKLRNFTLSMRPTRDGCKVFFTDGIGEHRPSFEEIQQMDDRFVRVTKLDILSQMVGIRARVAAHPCTPFHRLPELLAFVARFRFKSIFVGSSLGDCDFENQLHKVLQEVADHGLVSEGLEMVHSDQAIDFLKTQLRSEALRKLTLRGFGSYEAKDNILAFVCRPQFVSLDTNFECFHSNDLQQIVDYSNTLEKQWKKATITQQPFFENDVYEERESMLAEFASWMVRIDDGTGDPVLEDYGAKSKVTVNMGYYTVTVCFTEILH